jgi:hypothetical protein
LLPSEKARFVLPHIEGVGEDGLVLYPDDLLVNENPTVPHGFLDFDLTLRGVPDVDSGVFFTDGKRLP